MEGTSSLLRSPTYYYYSSSNNNTHLTYSSSSSSNWKCQALSMTITTTFLPNFNIYGSPNHHPQLLASSLSCPPSRPPRTSLLRTWAFVVDTATAASDNSTSSSTKDRAMPKIDKSGRFCSPRAARELALLTIYAACLEGSDPVRLFERRMNLRREPGYEFDKTSLMEYNHMSFGGPPVTTESIEEAEELLQSDEKDSAIEAEVLSAPPKLVYSKLLLRFTRKLLVAAVDKWDSNVTEIDKVSPPNWKAEPAGRILEFCILHLAMSEITVLGTRYQIVINEAVDLAKRFCDGAAPRIINGCLRTFVRDLLWSGEAHSPDASKKVQT